MYPFTKIKKHSSWKREEWKKIKQKLGNDDDSNDDDDDEKEEEDEEDNGEND